MNKKIINKVEILLIVVGVAFITLLMFFLHIYNNPSNKFSIYISTALSILVTLLIWLGCRVIVNYLWIKFPWEQKPFKHLLIEIIAIPAWAMLIMGISSYIYSNISNVSFSKGYNLEGFTIGILITLFITSLHESVYFYQQWKENFNLSLKLKKDNLEAKYETLKAQLNPHFLFNSLNTLITYVDDNPKASDYIQNLSDFMRYVLINKDKEVIVLRDEIDSCEKYMFLQQSRFGKNLEWSINLSDEIKNLFIAPLTLQMLLENVIKHNIISKEKKLKITIGHEKNEYLFIENNLQKKLSENSTGVGLKNIIDRYGYLSTFKTQIIETSTHFKVMIPLIKNEQ